MSLFQQLAHFIISAYTWVVIASVLFSWLRIPPVGHALSPAVRLVEQLTAPAYELIWRLKIPTQMGAFDFSPIIIFIALNLLDALILRVF